MPWFQTWFKTVLAARLAPADTSATLQTVPTATSGRLLLVNGNISEWCSYTWVSGSTVTGLTRGLSQTADPVTGGTGLDWQAGTQVLLVAMHDQIIDKEFPHPVPWFTTAALNALNMSEDYYTGTYPFAYDTTAGQYKYYNWSAWTTFSTGTVADASDTVAGKVEIATTAESKAGTDTGGTGAKLVVLPSDIAKNIQSSTFLYWEDSGGDDAYVVALTPVLAAYTTGQRLRAKLTTANTGACTIDFWPWAKSIKLIDWTDPLDGDIAAGGTYDFIYDGTNMVLQSVAVRATSSDITVGTNTLKYVTPAQLNSVIPSSNTYPNTLITSASYNTMVLFPTVWTTADAISNGWTENNAKLTANQWGWGIIFFDTASSLAASISTLIPWKWSQAYFRFADIGANAITVKTRIKFWTSPASVNEYLSWWFNNVDGAYNATNDSIRFCLDDNTGDKLYAVTADGSNNKNTNVTGSLTLTNWLNLAMVITSTNVLFYAGEGSTLTLVATHSAASSWYIPTSSTQMDLWWWIRDAWSQPDMYITPIYISLPTT